MDKYTFIGMLCVSFIPICMAQFIYIHINYSINDQTLKFRRIYTCVKYVLFPFMLLLLINSRARFRLMSRLTRPDNMTYDTLLKKYVVKDDEFYIVYRQIDSGRWVFMNAYNDYHYGLFYRTGTDQLITTHGIDICKGNACPIHNPSNHHMRNWPTNWRVDLVIMERICPHGIGHPDPDDHYVNAGVKSGIHGCDGCCTKPRINALIRAASINNVHIDTEDNNE